MQDTLTTTTATETHPQAAFRAQHARSPELPLVSIVVPAYNEAPIIVRNLVNLGAYMRSIEDQYRWELFIVNDGSLDDTGRLADAFAALRDNVTVIHHPRNLGLSEALRTGFAHCRGNYIVSLDADLSYSPDHIGRMLAKLREAGAGIVVASAYLRSGKTSDVPWIRRTLSISANRYLSMAAHGNLTTLTCMVRAYDAALLRSLLPRSESIEINPELLFEARLRGVKIEEIPAHLDWGCRKVQGAHISSMVIIRRTLAVLRCGLRYRPAMWLTIPGLIPGLLPLALALLFWLKASPPVILYVTAATIVVQYLSLALLSWQTTSFIARVFGAGGRTAKRVGG